MGQTLLISFSSLCFRVSYDVGNYPVSTMFSYELVADGNYHTVEILAIKKNFTLRVDGGLARYF